MIFIPGSLFLLCAIGSTTLALNYFPKQAVVTSSFFILRLAAYIFISIVVVNVVKKNAVEKWLKIFVGTGILFAIAGILQFLIFPNLASLQVFGWDPHMFRLVSTTLDPNFTGLILTFFASFSISLYLYKKGVAYLFIAAFFMACILLTFSRSSYLAIFTAVFTIGAVKSPKTFFLALAVFILSFVIIPQVRDRVVGAILIDETATARLISWQKALTIFSKNPLFGVGYDTYRYAQVKYGFVPGNGLAGGHSGAGSDSSFLLVLATTGLIGFSFFIVLIVSLAICFKKNLKKNYVSLAISASFVALLVHTQFVNSFMFPQIMLIFWFLTGLSYVSNH